VIRFILLLVLFTVVARLFWRFVDGVVRGVTGQTAKGGSRASAKPAAVKMQPCPVCGTYVVPGKAISLVSGGSPIYFDTEKCRAEYQSR
jgi:hypothetical protein